MLIDERFWLLSNETADNCTSKFVPTLYFSSHVQFDTKQWRCYISSSMGWNPRIWESMKSKSRECGVTSIVTSMESIFLRTDPQKNTRTGSRTHSRARFEVSESLQRTRKKSVDPYFQTDSKSTPSSMHYCWLVNLTTWPPKFPRKTLPELIPRSGGESYCSSLRLEQLQRHQNFLILRLQMKAKIWICLSCNPLWQLCRLIV